MRVQKRKTSSANPFQTQYARRHQITRGFFISVIFAWLTPLFLSLFTVAQAAGVASPVLTDDTAQRIQLQAVGASMAFSHFDWQQGNVYLPKTLISKPTLLQANDFQARLSAASDPSDESQISEFLESIDRIMNHARHRLASASTGSASGLHTERDESGDLFSPQTDMTLAEPIAHPNVTSHFGWRGSRPHQGTDFASPVGTPILASASGRVVFAGWFAGYGKMITIDHGNGIETRYAHCSKMMVQEGQLVNKGQRIGSIGMTGRSTGPHVHFELLANGIHLNPERYLNKPGRLASLKTAYKHG